jgi:hypothetical protein
MRHALINSSTGMVVNVIMLDPEVQADPKRAWPVPDGHEVVASDTAHPGDHWDGTKFTTPPV